MERFFFVQSVTKANSSCTWNSVTFYSGSARQFILKWNCRYRNQIPSVSQKFCKRQDCFLPRNLRQNIARSPLKYAGIQDMSINGMLVTMLVLAKTNPKIIIFKGIMKFDNDYYSRSLDIIFLFIQKYS